MLALALALLTLTAPADTTLPADVRGSWIQTDTVVVQPSSPGEPGAAFLYQHLEIGDSTLAALRVFDAFGFRTALLQQAPYGTVQGEVVTTSPHVVGSLSRLRLRADGDTLTVETLGADPITDVFVRGSPPDVPGLLGRWLGTWTDPATDETRAIPLDISADGTLRFGDGPAKGYRVAGPYLLVERVLRTDASESAEYHVGTFALDGDRLTIDAPDSEAITFSRQ